MRTLAAAFSDRRWKIHQVIGEGDTVVLFQNGKGVEHWAVRDNLSFLRQVGAFPSQPARPVPADA